MSILNWLHRKYPPRPPIIRTPWGPVTESARKQAAANIAADPQLKKKVIELIGESEARRRYPESFLDEK